MLTSLAACEPQLEPALAQAPLVEMICPCHKWSLQVVNTIESEKVQRLVMRHRQECIVFAAASLIRQGTPSLM